jgi:proton-translocating NADH-quinone oxidoreductase chain N
MNIIIIVFITAILALFSGIYNAGKYARWISLAGLALAFYFSFQPDAAFFAQYKHMYAFADMPSVWFTRSALLVCFGIFAISDFASYNHRSHQSELYALMLFSLSGALILFGFTNMITLFLGIEILSIPLYVLAGSNKTDLKSTEASMKYFLMGAFATGFLLFGMALIYGSTGHFNIMAIGQYAQFGADKMFVFGVLMMLVAFAFKVSLAPFHMWSPDVYQGSPSIITLFMSTIVKTAGFAAFFKLFVVAFPSVNGHWIDSIFVLVAITLILPNIMGLVQNNAKRLLAYSSVSHAGYIGLSFFSHSPAMVYNLNFYLLAYALASIGVFMCLIWVEKIKKENSIDAFKGLAKTQPLLAVLASVSLLSMAGLPLTAGFIGKFSLFSQSINHGNNGFVLVMVAVVGSALSIAYYLRLIMAMFFAPSSFRTAEKLSLAYKIMAIVLLAAIIGLGICPDVVQNSLMAALPK